MKRIILMTTLVAAAWLLTACGNDRVLRLMTYNVGAFGKELDDSAPMIARMIGELGAETVALNELDSCNRRHGINQVQHLADCLGAPWQGHFGRSMAFAGGAYGNGIVTRERIVNQFNIALPIDDGDEPRVCVVIETPRYVYAACHLDHIGKQARQTQARVITDELQRRFGQARKPVFLAGDFNDTPDSPVIRQLSRDWTLLSPLGDSYSAQHPHVCIDYIFLLRNGVRVSVLGGAVATNFLTGDVRTASDHLPVYVDVAF